MGDTAVQIVVSARHGHLSPGIQEKIKDKVEVVTRYFDRITAIHVTVDLEDKAKPAVELRVSAEHADEFIATAKTDDLMTALDAVAEKIEAQLRKHKERLRDHRAVPHKQMEPPAGAEDNA